MAFLQNFTPTSKAQLIQVAMFMNKGDVAKAQEFFDFYSKNLDLPDFDPVAPSFLEQLKTSATELYTWVKENQSDIVQGYQFIQSIVKNKGEVAGVSPLPPIND